MIILAPGALDKVFSAESSRKTTDAQDRDSRFSAWLKSSSQEAASSANMSGNAQATPYRNRLSRFE